MKRLKLLGGFDETMFGAEEIAMSRALKRQGQFVILNEAVVTSGRKVRAHSGWKILLTFSRCWFAVQIHYEAEKAWSCGMKNRAD